MILSPKNSENIGFLSSYLNRDRKQVKNTIFAIKSPLFLKNQRGIEEIFNKNLKDLGHFREKPDFLKNFRK